MKKLPIGIQSFVVLRNNDCLYVDKTEDIFRMINAGRIYFLSRPRRFGKSLLISVLEEIFKGNKALFEGLYIYDKINWTEHPAIRLDFTGRSYSTPEILQSSLYSFIDEVAENYSVTLRNTELNDRFGELIKRLHLQTGQRVAVLVDEYDKPITDLLSKPESANRNRDIIHDFYQVIKAVDEHIHFVFITGVSKFSGVSIFSGLNSPDDITLDEKYASICGYTQEELESYFTKYIDMAALHTGMNRQQLMNEIRTWYNGYSWDGKTPVYNPFSTLQFFGKCEFANYWFRTGTPTFLMEILKKHNRIERILTPVTVSSRAFDNFDPMNISELPLLFQTGYLTVTEKELIAGKPQYTISIPNQEVKESLFENLLNAYTDYPLDGTDDLRQRMQSQLRTHNVEGLEESLREMIASIPYMLTVNNEAYFHSIMLVWLKLLGFSLTGELPTHIGRIDAVWQLPGHVIIVEVKSQSQKGNIPQLLDKALKQIREKRYYERFTSENKVSLLGVAFARNEIGCRMENI